MLQSARPYYETVHGDWVDLGGKKLNILPRCLQMLPTSVAQSADLLITDPNTTVLEDTVGYEDLWEDVSSDDDSDTEDDDDPVTGAFDLDLEFDTAALLEVATGKYYHEYFNMCTSITKELIDSWIDAICEFAQAWREVKYAKSRLRILHQNLARAETIRRANTGGMFQKRVQEEDVRILRLAEGEQRQRINLLTERGYGLLAKAIDLERRIRDRCRTYYPYTKERVLGLIGALTDVNEHYSLMRGKYFRD